MVNTIWVAVTSLAGVVIGGMLSLFTQHVVSRSADRRQAAAVMEGRRGERLAHLIAFIDTAQEAERLAVSRHRYRARGAVWNRRVDAALDQLWVRLRAVQLLCPGEVGEAAHALAWQVHTVLREGAGGQPVAAFLHSSRENLIDRARADLGRV